MGSSRNLRSGDRYRSYLLSDHLKSKLMAQAPAHGASGEQVPLSVVIEKAQTADIDALARISGQSFETDTHTQLKSLFHGATAHADGSREAMKGWLDHPKVDFLVAKDADTGRVLGSIAWGRRGYEGDVDLPMDKPEEPKPPGECPKKISDLAAMTDYAIQSWAYDFMPEGCRCRFIISLTIDPAYQGRGIGTKLIRWGTELADADGVYCWVSSSMDGVKAYDKCGFRVVGQTEADLDEYAEGKRRPMQDGSEGSWGRYIWWYMRREPQT